MEEALTELLRFPVPTDDQKTAADYQSLRSKTILTILGEAVVSRPYYLCRHCHNGQLPADIELDIEGRES